jgi:hypothetical protein
MNSNMHLKEIKIFLGTKKLFNPYLNRKKRTNPTCTNRKRKGLGYV